MKPGKELDIEVAKKIFHYVIVMDGSNKYSIESINGKKRPVENFSTDTNDAHLVIRKISEIGYVCNVRSEIDLDGNLFWFAGFFNKENQQITFSQGETLGHSVCLSALKLIEGIEC